MIRLQPLKILILTFIKSQIYKQSTDAQLKSNQMLGFGERGKPEYPEKTCRRKVENQQTQPTYDARGLFLESPGNLTGPKSYFEIKVSRKVGSVLSSNEVHFVSLADTFTA